MGLPPLYARRWGHTPLKNALDAGHNEVATRLREHGAKMPAGDSDSFELNKAAAFGELHKVNHRERPSGLTVYCYWYTFLYMNSVAHFCLQQYCCIAALYKFDCFKAYIKEFTKRLSARAWGVSCKI